MPLSHLTISNLAENPILQKRIAFALRKAAQSISVEAQNIPNRAIRRAFAQRVIEGALDMRNICLYVLADPNVIGLADAGTDGQNIGDNIIDGAIAAGWNAMAGI